MFCCLRIISFASLVFVAACAYQGKNVPEGGNPSDSPEIRALIADVQSEYINCMVPKLPGYDDLVSDVAIVAAALRASCSSEAVAGAEKLRTIEASQAFRNALAEEYLSSLEGHSIRLVTRWRKHVFYREPPFPVVNG